MVVKAICGKKGFLNVQAHRRLDKSRKDIPVGLPTVLPIYDVQWGEECDTWRMIFAGSG